METLENLALFCCSSMLCLTFVAVFAFLTVGRRLLRGIDTGKKGAGGFMGIDLGFIGDLLNRR